jgi:GNAT superfamily N-acetyltransferase
MGVCDLIYLRAADRFDADELAELRAASLHELGLLPPADVAAFTVTATHELRALFAAERITAWIACDDARVVASCCAVFYDRLPYPEGSRHAELCGVYVRPAYRKRGFASELVREVVAAAQAGGARKTFLRPAKSAKNLYARLGFVDTELMAHGTAARVASGHALARIPDC